MVLIVRNITQTSMQVAWDSHGSSVAHYNIELYYGPDEYGDMVEGKQIYGISPSARSYNFLGLESGRLYHVKFYSKNSSQQTIKIERINFSTLSNNPVPGTPSLSVSVTNRRNLRITGSKGSDTTYIEIYINGSRQWNMYMGANSSFDVTYYGSYSTRYTVEAFGRNSWNTGSSTTRTVTTLSEPPPDPPPAPSGLNMYDSGETWASFAWNSVSSAEKYAMEIFIGSSLVSGKYDYNIFGTTKQFTGLSPGITYTAKLYGWNAGGNGTPTYLDFTLGYSRPANFSWDITKSKGRSYTLKAGRFTDLVSYAEFSSFRQRINDFRRYKKLSQYTFSNIAIGTVLSDTLYNQLESAIKAMSPPISTPGQKSSGAELVVLLNGVRNSLNSIK